MEQYEAVIGLEIHAELMTNSKMFCGAPVVDNTSAEPNTAVQPLCLGMPGTLPVINRQAVEFSLKVALALNCGINYYNRFARKNYFYPDLPKGYQLSQYEEPIGEKGWVDIELESGESKRIRIRRVHMEEDTGKLTHVGYDSWVDYNRAGVPLLEIVTEPDIHSAEEAAIYATKLRQILRYLEVNSGDLEKGVLRVEPNISVRPKGTDQLNTRTEVKNLNSFRSLFLASEYEIKRQIDLVRKGQRVVQETRGWHDDKKITFSQRIKEDAHDYRYFPEPDLPPLRLDPEYVEEIRSHLPEMPWVKADRYQQLYGLSVYEAKLLSEERPTAEWFEAAVALGGTPKAVANWLLNNLFNILNEAGMTLANNPITPQALVGLLQQIEKGVINNNIAKSILVEMFNSGDSADAIIAAKGLAQVSDEGAIRATICRLFDENKKDVDDYLSGKTKVRGFLIGKIMKEMKGKGNPAIINQLFDEEMAKLAEG